MKSFILATIAATAMALDNEKIVIDQAAIVSVTPAIDLGELTVKSGWKKNGASTDALLDMMLILEATPTGTTNYMVND